MKIAVLGVGGVGGLVAAALERSGTPVVVVVREETARVLDALHVRSETLGEFDAHPRIVTSLDEDHDALIVATKAGGLSAGLDRVTGAPGLVVPLLNGLDHMDVLRARFGDRVIAGSIRVEADRPSPGLIVHTSRFLRIDMSGGEELAERFRAAGIETRILDSDAQVLWSKLVRLNALACTTSATGELLGPIREHRRELLEGAVREAAAVAAAEGAEVDPAEVMAELDAAHATLGSSMARDIAAGRPAEVDAIPGAVLRAAARHDIEAPVIAGLVDEIQERIRRS